MSNESSINDTAPRSLHPVHVGHLVMGLAFLGVVAVWAMVQSEVVSNDDIRWLLPLPWVFAGAAGLLAVVLSGRGRGAPSVPAAPPLDETDQPTDPNHEETP